MKMQARKRHISIAIIAGALRVLMFFPRTPELLEAAVPANAPADYVWSA